MPPVPPASIVPPAVPGYVLETLLGRGGSGEVWRAVPRRGGDAVAVKVLVAGEPERQAREAALLGALDHPHLVRLIEVVHQPRRGSAARVALVLELLAGGSLASLLARRGRLRPGEVVTAIAPVAAALAHAHGNGVVHGDLSPGNIVFTAEGRPVLTDLGVARVLGETAAAEVTPPYVDPTVARGGAPGPASDVFGVAAAAFHALTGIAPWNAATPADTLAVAAGGHLPDLAELAPDAPAELVTVISRGLAADPHDRGSAAAFALDLRHACRPEPVRLPVDGVPDAELSRTGAGPRTELTHQVPGRRARPAPVVVAPPGRGELWRDRLREGARTVSPRAGVLAGALAVLLAVGWFGLRWAEDGGTPGGAPTVAAAVGSDLPEAAAGAPPAPGPGASAADRQEAPSSAQEWWALVTELYDRRAAAFTAGSPERLGDVYTDGSPLRIADEEHVRGLTAAGEVVRGFDPTVAAVTAAAEEGGRVEMDLVDRWPAYDVVAAGDPDGPAVRSVAGRAEATVRMVLLRTEAGWRIESARRLA
ncbi:serine/threonine-protein kinase [Blastococcus haudaquaticus]|uniref:Serine/threonine protein kinase n=1 Tax=Blastococcus haudaquaticus TaxID=1938745 RepID=A0A286H5B7_9ACTN|nr:serine/threonine-protein kinase [Blastococcus haudaquaticus]SOE02882.1 Serine/threonine protein kinase [Blastococcus haudaquaticus]